MDLPALLADRLERDDGLVALDSGDRAWSYAELDQATRDRAAWLRRLCPDGGRVVVSGEHTADALIWALAVMRSGLVYTPLSPVLPAGRTREAIRVAAPQLVLCCTPAVLAVLREEGTGRRVLSPDEVEQATAAEPGADEPGTAAGTGPSSEIAYSIFTSGSTGVPKLVNVGHDGIENLCKAQARLFGVKPGHRMLQFSALSFDASIAEMLVAIYAGAALVVPGWDGNSWLSSVGRHLQKKGCDIITVPPSVYARLDDEARKGIGTVVFAGETLPEAEFRAAARYSRVLNAYGPTEGTVCFSVAEPSRFTTSIGRPIDGYTARVYDAGTGSYAGSGRGELVLVGTGVALGYEGWPPGEPSPFTTVDGSPAYHTGDEVSLRDGELYYLGRLDEQVKRLGHRIVLTELEGWLGQILGTSVLAVADGTSLVMAHTAAGRPEAELRALLRGLLAPWEMPDVLLALPDLPLTSNGKADRAAVRELASRTGQGSGNGQADSLGLAGHGDHEIVRRIVERVLGTGIGPSASVFDVGADSLALVRIQVELGDAFGEEPVQAVFDQLNYDFTVDGFVTGLRGQPGTPPSTEQEVLAAATAQLTGFPALLTALRPARGSTAGYLDAVTVTGASGFIGGRVLDRLLGGTRRVTVVTTSDPRRLVSRHCARFGRDPADFASVEFLSYNEAGALATGTGKAGAVRWGPVVHCGYDVNHLLPLKRQLDGSVAATGTLVRAAAALDAPRFVFLSAASAGPHFVPLTQAALSAVSDPYSQSKLVAEAYAGALEGERCRVDLMRAGLVYGHTAREREFLDRDVFAQLMLLSRRHGMLPRLDGLVPTCHVADLADTLLAAAGSDGPGARSVLVHRTYDLNELREELGFSAAQVVDAQEWLSTITQAHTADLRILAALRLWLGKANWAEPVHATCRPVIRELHQTGLGV